MDQAARPNNSSPAGGGGGGGSSEDGSPAQLHQQSQQPAKRTRVLLSCGVCRASKLKCDRTSPCGQCVKKGRPEACAYAPRPRRKAPPESMRARLRRLEGMVRGFMEEEEEGEGGGADEQQQQQKTSQAGKGRSGVAEIQEDGEDEDMGMSASAGGSGGTVVRGTKTTSYVGGTHFMAMLEDIEDLKNFFDDPDDEDERQPAEAWAAAGTPEMLMLVPDGEAGSKEALLALLPERAVVERLMNRYFNSNSPSQHVIHRPTFARQYAEFVEDPSAVRTPWLALLLMVVSLGVYFSKFQAPHELEGDVAADEEAHGGAGGSPSSSSSSSPMGRFWRYRAAGGRALAMSRYSQPEDTTLQALMLYVEAAFMGSRVSQMSCFLLSSVLIRLMLKMGLHRDPDKMCGSTGNSGGGGGVGEAGPAPGAAGLTPFDGEMRRRVWHLAVQLDLLVGFHLGLPAMLNGIETDTRLPRNLTDDDFGQWSRELPPARPESEYTPSTYPINKARIARAFGLVARQAHALAAPAYAEVLRVDAVIDEVYHDRVPAHMKVRPMAECALDPAMQVIQRFGLASLYHKSRCVLHRPYIAGPAGPDGRLREEHRLSRAKCLDSALHLLEYQSLIHQGCRAGGMLSAHEWFISSIATNDFLLANMILAIVIQSEHYASAGGDPAWTMEMRQTPPTTTATTPPGGAHHHHHHYQQQEQQSSSSTAAAGGGAAWMTTPPAPSKRELYRRLVTSYAVWAELATKEPDCRKALGVVRTLLRKLEPYAGDAAAVPGSLPLPGTNAAVTTATPSYSATTATTTPASAATGSASTFTDRSDEAPSMADLNLNPSSNPSTGYSYPSTGPSEASYAAVFDAMGTSNGPSDMEGVDALGGNGDNWFFQNGGYNWRNFDTFTNSPMDALQPPPQMPDDAWFSSMGANMDGLYFGPNNVWGSGPPS